MTNHNLFIQESNAFEIEVASFVLLAMMFSSFACIVRFYLHYSVGIAVLIPSMHKIPSSKSLSIVGILWLSYPSHGRQ